jgi:hypothetical protein
MMVQPKTPPLSIRPGDVRLALVDAYAAKHGLNRHAAVLRLIDVGLKGRANAAAAQAPAIVNVAPVRSEPMLDKGGEPVKFQGTTLHVDVPLAGTFKRPLTQKGGKK